MVEPGVQACAVKGTGDEGHRQESGPAMPVFQETGIARGMVKETVVPRPMLLFT